MTGTPAAATLPTPAPTPELTGWQRSIYGGGYALVLSSALTSAIGMVFWVVAARDYDQAIVGRNSALLFAIMFLSGVAQLNLLNVLVRFVPVAGHRSARFVALAYLVGGGLAGLAGMGFALTARVVEPGLAADLRGPLAVVGFGAACAVWAIFTMQDGVLSAVRRSGVVALENGVFSVLKLAAVAALARVLPVHGILVSWMTATAVVVLVTNGYLFGRALPDYVRRVAGTAQPIPFRGVLGYLGGDYLGMLCWLACTQLLPVLVHVALGSRQTAIFTMVWTIAYALYLVPAGMGQSLVAHTSADIERLADGSRGVQRRSFLLIGPAVAVLALGAPLVLRVLGPGYVGGAWALRLAALSALPNVITACAVSTARVHRRMMTVVAILASISVLAIGLASALMPRFGIAGVGLAMLIAQTVVAAAVLLSRAPWLPRPIVGPFAAMRRAGLLNRVAPVALAGLPGGRWRVTQPMPGRSDAAAAVIADGAGGTALLKVADSSAGVIELRRQEDVLGALHHDPAVGDWARLAPVVLHSGSVGLCYYQVQSRLPGRDLRLELRDPGVRGRFLREAVRTVGELHRRTARPVRADAYRLAGWVGEPANEVRAVVHWPASDGLDRVVAVLTGALADRLCPIGWTHGDLSADNLLLSDGRVTGVCDWGQARPDGFVLADLTSLVLATEVEASGRELGTVVLDWLRAGDPPAFALLTAAQGDLGGDRLDARALLLLGWLRMVAGNLAKSRRYAANPLWLKRNVSDVLRSIAVGEVLIGAPGRGADTDGR